MGLQHTGYIYFIVMETLYLREKLEISCYTLFQKQMQEDNTLSPWTN